IRPPLQRSCACRGPGRRRTSPSGGPCLPLGDGARAPSTTNASPAAAAQALRDPLACCYPLVGLGAVSAVAEGVHNRNPPTNALSLSPARQRSGSFLSFLTLPPPSTTSSGSSAAIRRSTTSLT